MRLPLAPSKSPATDTVSSNSVFGVVHMLREGHNPTYQKVAAEVAQDVFRTGSLLVENMVGGFSQRCDHLMDDLTNAMEAPGFFTGLWSLSVYEAGIRNEQWVRWWSQMRRPERQS